MVDGSIGIFDAVAIVGYWDGCWVIGENVDNPVG